MTSTETLFTIRDYERLPEGFPCELIEGELVKEPSPFYSHQSVVSALHVAWGQVLDHRCVVEAPLDVVIDDFSVLQPDLAVWRRAPDRDVRWVPAPTIVVEVLSRSTASRDRDRKTHLYLGAGVEEVWLVDPTDGRIEVCVSNGASEHAPDERVTSRAIPTLSATGAELIR